jgi:hypothetical protein
MASQFKLGVWAASRFMRFCCTALCLGLTSTALNAALQFDVFLGYDGIVPQASWFPVVCEIKNDGPTFTGTIELSGDNNQGQTVRTTVELPSGTLKRVVIPVFSSARLFGGWDLRLLDERGRTRAEQTSVRARRQLAPRTALLGALSRTPGGSPVIRQIASAAASSTGNSDLQPAAARLLPSIFPDNPLVLEGLSGLYLNSERASDLSVSQVNSILAWLYSGGHLIVAVEQPSEITASPWLKGIFPSEVRDLRTITRHAELQDWVRNAVIKTNVTSTPDQAVRRPPESLRLPWADAITGAAGFGIRNHGFLQQTAIGPGF